MKNARRIIWGIILIALGVVTALSALELFIGNIFFEGWWTLLIIIPSFVGFVTSKKRWGYLCGVGAGVLMLLCSRGILEYDMLGKLVAPVLIFFLGIRLFVGGVFNGKTAAIEKNMAANHIEPQRESAFFSSKELCVSEELFEGAALNAVFGGVTYDLREAVVEKDALIRVSALFGGVTVLLPANVKVKIGTTSLFGGVSSKRAKVSGDAPTVYITGGCLFGGATIK